MIRLKGPFSLTGIKLFLTVMETERVQADV